MTRHNKAIFVLPNNESTQVLLAFLRKHLPRGYSIKARCRGPRINKQTNVHGDLKKADAVTFAVYFLHNKSVLPPEEFTRVFRGELL